jgi:hypothetical protein
MDKVGPILLFLAGCAAAFFIGLYVRSRYFSRPKTFHYGGEIFIWVPDKGEGLSFFRKHYEHGSFQYADGTPVTDHRLHRMLQESWVRQNRPDHSTD